MSFNLPTEHPEFFTSTIHNWLGVLKSHQAKLIIIDALKYFHVNNIAIIYAFVIMDNHIHIIWQPCFNQKMSDLIVSLRKHTSKQLIKLIIEKEDVILGNLEVKKYDRKIQIWKRNPLSITLFSQNVFQQKLEYIHNNPVKAGLCTSACEYFYSSAEFYNGGVNHSDFLTHYL